MNEKKRKAIEDRNTRDGFRGREPLWTAAAIMEATRCLNQGLESLDRSRTSIPSRNADSSYALECYERGARWIAAARRIKQGIGIAAELQDLILEEESGEIDDDGDFALDHSGLSLTRTRPAVIRTTPELSPAQIEVADQLRRRDLCTRGCGTVVHKKCCPVTEPGTCEECGTEWVGECPHCGTLEPIPSGTLFRAFERECDWPCDQCAKCGRRIPDRSLRYLDPGAKRAECVEGDEFCKLMGDSRAKNKEWTSDGEIEG